MLLRLMFMTILLCSPLLGAKESSDNAFSSGAKQTLENGAWTWFFAKRFDANERAQFHNKSQATFLQLNTPQFSQLIFSWNAQKPTAGHISFFVQARSAKTKQWLAVHHLVDWGHNVQCTYPSVAKCESAGQHVRLEIPAMADSYRIRVEAHGGADLADLRGLFVNIADLQQFPNESARKIAPGLSTVQLPDVPRYSQKVLNHPRAAHMCSPTSLSMLLSYIAATPVNPLAVADEVYDRGLDTYGSWPFNVAFAYQATGNSLAWWVMRLPSFVDLHRHLKRGMPVMVSVRGPLKGQASPYANGHLLLVVGYDARHKKVICHDPAFETDNNVFVKYDLGSFLAAWGRSRNLAIMVDAPGNINQA